jgi:hypothetical protein
VASVLVVGEALWDAVVRPDDTVTEHPGGSPLNVATSTEQGLALDSSSGDNVMVHLDTYHAHRGGRHPSASSRPGRPAGIRAHRGQPPRFPRFRPHRCQRVLPRMNDAGPLTLESSSCAVARHARTFMSTLPKVSGA